MKQGLVTVDNAYIEYLTALGRNGKVLHVILMNNSTKVQEYDLEACGCRMSGTVPAWGMEVLDFKMK